jgi:nitroreductase
MVDLIHDNYQGACMNLGLSADEVLSTTRAVRKRLDFDRPVETEVLVECLRLAMQAPSGSNQQGYQWVFVTDPEKRRQVGEVYREKFNINHASNRAKTGEMAYGVNDSRAEGFEKMMGSVAYLSENIERVPVLMVPCVEGRMEGATLNVMAAKFGSIVPAVWSFMLALRERGLGSTWTSAHLKEDGEQRVADILGIPIEQYTQVGLFPIAYTIGTDFKVSKRLDPETLMHINHW